MKTTTVSLMLLLVPAALAAQVGAQAQASAAARFGAPSGFSADGSARLDTIYAEARARHVPQEPIARRVAEGRAKGASEGAIIASADDVRLNLEVARAAMIAGGRPHPNDEECARGAAAIERGASGAQIRAIAKSAPRDRSLVVAFDVLARLTRNGMPADRAAAEVQSGVRGGATDASLTTLATAAVGPSSLAPARPAHRP
jgi:hypothetical protein